MTRLGSPYDEYLLNQARHAAGLHVEEQVGTSGFWGQPDTGLDPRLIDPKSEKVLPRIREFVLKTLYHFWGERYNNPEEWSEVWIAGSALSHQFQEHEQPDLDVLIGVNYEKFFEDNPEYAGIGQQTLSEQFNDEFRNILDPLTADWNGYEVTFYVNPGATDIRSINPYAAYSLTKNEWTVKPVDVPEHWDPKSYFPNEWWKTINTEVNNAETLVAQYNTLSSRVRRSPLGSIAQTSALVQLRNVTDRATNLFKDIHARRKLAFSPSGKGYFDYHNLRWQAHKRAGTVKALHEIAVVNQLAKEHEENVLYGEHIDSPEAAIVKAQLFQSNRPAWYKRALS